ncbi:hypothetical protein BGX27_005059, partial [Mortierella sp. AM989]
MKFFAAIVALVAASVANAQVPWTNCATAPAMTVTYFSVTPYPACLGKQGCFTATGTLNNPVIAPATLSIVGKYFGQTVYTDNHDFCALLAATGQPCPIPITMTSVTVCVLVKPNAPVGIPITLTVSATNGDGRVLFCQRATITV